MPKGKLGEEWAGPLMGDLPLASLDPGCFLSFVSLDAHITLHFTSFEWRY
jgi:hypothetical protein